MSRHSGQTLHNSIAAAVSGVAGVFFLFFWVGGHWGDGDSGGGERGGHVVLAAAEAEIRAGTEGGGHLQSGGGQFPENTGPLIDSLCVNGQ